MRISLLASLVGCALLSIVPANATPTTFNFTAGGTENATNINNFGNSFVFGTGFTVTVSAISNATSSSTTGTTVRTAEVGQYFGTDSVGGNPAMPMGLGICNQNEGLDSAACTTPQHQVDDHSGYDFMLFQFTTAVDLNSIVLSTYDGVNTGDAQDFTYITGSGNLTFTPGTTTLSSLISGATTSSCSTYFNTSALYSCNDGASNSYDATHGFGTNTNNVQWLLIGAADPVGSTDNYFKISSLSATVHTAAPEPATFGIFGVALVGLGLFGRKRLHKS